MIDVKIEFNKAKYNQLMDKIQQLGKRIGDMRPVWEIWEKWYREEQIAKAFNTRGKVFGAKWANYNPKYLKWKQKYHSGKPMLVLSGKMKEAALGGSGYIIKKTKNQMSFGLKGEPYYAAIQFGGKNMPQRPYIIGYNKEILRRQ